MALSTQNGGSPLMNQAFDPLNLLILAVAVFIFFRLRSVLGTRTGHERRYDRVPGTPAKDARANDNVVPLPGHEPKDEPVYVADAPEDKAPVWKGYAEDGSALAGGLEAIAAAEPEFSPKTFLEGARVAYEMIVMAFAQGDRKALKPLLSREVFSGFSQALDDRQARGETLESRFVGIDKCELVNAVLSGRKIQLTIRILSQMITALRNRDGKIIDGDDKKVSEITDIWTFEREAGASDPNWRLVATEETA
jgi:predicted lipid-binding transport protein (Tim44 family)